MFCWPAQVIAGDGGVSVVGEKLTIPKRQMLRDAPMPKSFELRVQNILAVAGQKLGQMRVQRVVVVVGVQVEIRQPVRTAH